jgi:hypothetical protein
MASAALLRATNLKIIEFPVYMVHASSSYACAEDGYFKSPHLLIIDGDVQSDSGEFFVFFELAET